MSWIVVNIGCIECGVSTQIVGVFDDEEYANTLADKLHKSHSWREGGQNAFEVFPMPELNVVHSEYGVQKPDDISTPRTTDCTDIREGRVMVLSRDAETGEARMVMVKHAP